MNSHQFSLFGKPIAPVAGPRAPEQAQQLARVSGRIGECVVAFCRSRVGSTFRAAELAQYVQEACGGAPASADRVMRQLRAQGYLDVQLEDRAGSLYRVVQVRG